MKITIFRVELRFWKPKYCRNMAIYGDIRHILKPHGPKNRENLDFEISYGKFSERTGENDRTIGKLIWRRKSVQNPFFLNLRFFRPCQIT